MFECEWQFQNLYFSSPDWSMSHGPEGFAEAGCDFTNCQVTPFGSDLTPEEFQSFDAVLFHLENFIPWPWEVNRLHKIRKQQQRYLILHIKHIKESM